MVRISALRKDFQRRLATFLWNEWGQMGVLAEFSKPSRWAADPEALLLLTFEVGREEPRLLDEVLDWLVANERLISVQRLRNLSRDDSDRAVIEAVIGWLGERRRRPRLGARSQQSASVEPFFRGSQLPVEDPDPAFLAQGLTKPRYQPSGKSQTPNLRTPVNFAFRLRLLLGIGVRAEAIRVLLTSSSPRMEVQALARSTGYNKRNVQEGLAALTAAGEMTSWQVGNEQRFEAPRESWARFLDLKQLPEHVDWPQLFSAYRQILRWLVDPRHQNLSAYMLSSEARTLVEEVTPDLRFAGFAVDGGGQVEDGSYFERFAKSLLELGPI